MVTQYGMSDDMGPIYLGGDHDEVMFLARDYGQPEPHVPAKTLRRGSTREVQRKMNDAYRCLRPAISKGIARSSTASLDLLVEKERRSTARSSWSSSRASLPRKERKKTCSGSRNRFNRQSGRRAEKGAASAFPYRAAKLRDTERA